MEYCEFCDLPDDVLGLIASFLPLTDVMMFSLTSKAISAAVFGGIDSLDFTNEASSLSLRHQIQFATQCFSLQKLKLNFGEDEVLPARIQPIKRLRNQLTVLGIHTSDWVEIKSETGMSSYLNKFRHLKEIYLSGFSMERGLSVQLLSQLRVLSLCRCTIMSSLLYAIPEHCKMLESLSIKHIALGDHDSVAYVSPLWLCPQLRVLDLSDYRPGIEPQTRCSMP